MVVAFALGGCLSGGSSPASDGDIDRDSASLPVDSGQSDSSAAFDAATTDAGSADSGSIPNLCAPAAIVPNRDFNGDGYDDFVVGEFAYTGAFDWQGRVYVYFGAAGIGSGPLVPTVILEGGMENQGLGAQVEAVGDVNGDGFGDVAAAGAGAASVHVWFGGPGSSFDATENGTISEPGYVPRALGAAGDVNGDGFADVLVGLPEGCAPQPCPGEVRLYLGGPGTSFDTSADAVITGPVPGPNPGEYFGYGVSTAGDVNGDCYSDVVVGALFGGYVHLYLGGPGSFDTTPDAVLTGADFGFGAVTGTAGDVNNDGYDDVFVLAVDPGTAYVYLGGPGPFDTTPDGVMYAGMMGRSGTSADLDGDGYSDLVVAGWDLGLAGDGVGFVYRGGSGSAFDTTLDFYLDSFMGLPFGSDLYAADLNGDGLPDVVSGGQGSNVVPGNAQLFISTLPVGISSSADETITGVDMVGSFGRSVGGTSAGL